eukprot:scaffold209625_cov24-Tisochrysis_lutea.AAC.1
MSACFFPFITNAGATPSPRRSLTLVLKERAQQAAEAGAAASSRKHARTDKRSKPETPHQS